MKSEPLYKQIQNDIRDMIKSGVLRKGDLVMSEKELAQKYRVSQITSKNALIGLAEEGLLVRIKGKGTFVQATPDELQRGQTGDPARTAGGPSRGWTGGFSGANGGIAGGGSPGGSMGAPLRETVQTRTIGLIIPTMKTIVDQRFLDGIEKCVAAAGYDLMLRITRESQEEESRAIENFLQLGVRGMIIFPVENENYNDSILRLSLERFPLVLIDRFLKEIKTYSVSSDNVSGTCEAVGMLLDKGHSSIGFISPEITNTVTDERARGFETAFLNRKYAIDKSLWCLIPLETIASGQAGARIHEFLKQHPEMTAVFTVNTELCRYTYTAAAALGKRVPQDLELVTFDPPGMFDVPYVQQHEEEMCKTTVSLLLEQMEGKYEPRRIVVPVRVVVPETASAAAK